MATYTLVPNETLAPDSGDWDINTASTIHEAIDASGGGYIYQSATNKDFRVGFSTISLAAGETIDSVKACITAHTSNTRSDTATTVISIQDGSNSNHFTDSHTVTPNLGVPATYCSDEETTSAVTSTTWTGNDIAAIRMMGEVTAFSGGGPSCVLYYAYLVVETTIADPQKALIINSSINLNGQLTIK